MNSCLARYGAESYRDGYVRTEFCLLAGLGYLHALVRYPEVSPEAWALKLTPPRPAPAVGVLP